MWGAATAAYQVEGAAAEDGRKPSVWDTFSHTPGHIKTGDTGDIACDHYHRYKEDVKLMVELGIKHYRFSISWPRVVPDGRGAVNEKAGVDFYSRLVDLLLENGITPHCTLFHWDSPQALEDLYGSVAGAGDIAKDFADDCNQTVKRLGDRLTNWITINEIYCFHLHGLWCEPTAAACARHDRQKPKRKCSRPCITRCSPTAWPARLSARPR